MCYSGFMMRSIQHRYRWWLGADRQRVIIWATVTETEMSFWWNFHHWLHWKLSFWQLSVQPVMKISSKWRHFRFSGCRSLCRHMVSRDPNELIAKSSISVNQTTVFMLCTTFIYFCMKETWDHVSVNWQQGDMLWTYFMSLPRWGHVHWLISY